MALKGTLKDFGIADILQLIGQQQKTGMLHLKAKEQEVDIGFKDGNIVKAESSTRNKKDLIGNMLVRAEIITQQRLDFALETQRRSLQRLGDVLVAAEAITVDRFKEMVQLQTTETLYGLFSWKSGTYEFEQKEVDFDQNSVTPLRAESVLMEGFRMVDEWPLIKKRVTSYQMTFEKLKDAPAAAAPPPKADDFDSALDDAFDGLKKEVKKHDNSMGENEHKVLGLIAAGRDVRKLIDLSCLGEFETCKALSNLVQQQVVKAVAATGKAQNLGHDAPALQRVAGAVGRVVVTMGVLAGLVLVATKLSVGSVGLMGAPPSSAADPATQRLIAREQVARIEAALAVYRLEKGEVPDKLEALVSEGLLAREDLRYPWREDYYYRRAAKGGFVLLPPLR
ncbi:MAG: DUF4388 domain-containing protein [Myxococcaceae bacterium]